MDLLALDAAEALDPARAGAKAAWLARAFQVGLPVLPGAVVPAEVSRPYLNLGADELAAGGSGRARLAIMREPLPTDLAAAITRQTMQLSAPLVVRSSSILEGSGLWSGAFTSYLDVNHNELPKAVVGCFASAFTQAAVERFAAAGVSPSRAAIAVLIQPALVPDFGGTARFVGDQVVVVGVKGSPVPLVQGWDPGVQARVTGEGDISGRAAIDALGQELISRVAETLAAARTRIGATSCEWAVTGDELWLLQLQRFTEAHEADRSETIAELATEEAAAISRLVRRFPGALGEEVVLPWAIADPELADLPVTPAPAEPPAALREAVSAAAMLTAQTWGRPKPVSQRLGRDMLRNLRGPEPGQPLLTAAGLRRPDRATAEEVLRLVAAARRGLVDAGAFADEATAWHISVAEARQWLSGNTDAERTPRVGFDRWEPFHAAVVKAHGAEVIGTSAAPGIGFGRMCVVTTPGAAAGFRPRDVVVSTHPVPGLAPLLFDASALVTTGGSSAAHLFESARSLGIPALCGTRIEDLVDTELAEVEGEWALTVDGTAGTVHGVPW